MHTQLSLLGLGIRGLRQLTIETRDAIRRCRVVFHIGENHAALKRLNPNTVDLHKLYWTGEKRGIVYARIVKRVLSELELGGEIALVTYGHPFVFDDVNAMLAKHCRRRKIPCRVLPAVSCLDTLSIDLQIDYGDGLQVYEATAFVENEHLIDPAVHLLLLQAGEFNHEETSDTIKHKVGRYRPLVRYLRRFYPSAHRVVVVYSDAGDGAVRRSTRLSALDKLRHVMFPGTTLYVPPK